MDQEYIKIGAEILEEGMLSEIEKIAERNPSIGIPMQKFWSGEISWKEHINMISNNMQEQIIHQLMSKHEMNNIKNTDMYKNLK